MFDHSFVTRIRHIGITSKHDYWSVEGYTGDGSDPDDPLYWMTLHNGTAEACENYTRVLHGEITPDMASNLDPRKLKRL